MRRRRGLRGGWVRGVGLPRRSAARRRANPAHKNRMPRAGFVRAVWRHASRVPVQAASPPPVRVRCAGCAGAGSSGVTPDAPAGGTPAATRAGPVGSGFAGLACPGAAPCVAGKTPPTKKPKVAFRAIRPAGAAREICPASSRRRGVRPCPKTPPLPRQLPAGVCCRGGVCLYIIIFKLLTSRCGPSPGRVTKLSFRRLFY